MADVERTRARPAAPGLSSPFLLADRQGQIALAEVQGAIQELFAKLEGLKAAPASVEGGDVYDDSGLVRQVRILSAELEALKRRVAALERTFPVVRRCRVKEDLGDYLACVFYNHLTDEEGGDVFVAKPYDLRVTPFDGESFTTLDGHTVSFSYSEYWERTATIDDSETVQTVTPYYYVNEEVCVARTEPGIEDAEQNPIQWEDINLAGRNWGGAGGLKVYYGNSEDAVRSQTPSETFAIGFGTDDRTTLFWERGEWHYANRFKAYP